MLRFYPFPKRQFIYSFKQQLHSKKISILLFFSIVMALVAIAVLNYMIMRASMLRYCLHLEQELATFKLLVGFLSLLLVIAGGYIYKQTQVIQKANQYANQQKSLLSITNNLRESLEFNTILETTVTEIYKLLNIDRITFNWYHPEQKMLETVCEYRQDKQPIKICCFDIKNFGDLGNYLSRQETVIIENISQNSNLDKNVKLAYLEIGTESYLALPVLTINNLCGYLICHSFKSKIWDKSEIIILETIIKALAMAINHALLYEESQEKIKLIDKNFLEFKSTHTQLIQAEKMSSLSQLVAGIAHEINNPINFIYGNLTYTNEYVQNLFSLVKIYQQQYPQPTPEIEDKIQEIELEFLIEDLPKVLSSMRVGADRINEVVHSLRNFSRLDESAMKPVNIHQGIDSTLLILQHRLKSNPESPGIEVVKKYGTLSAVECYAGQLNQVFMNILNNAIDALEDYHKKRSPQEISQHPSRITIQTEMKNTLGGIIDVNESTPPTAYPLVLIPFVVISIKDNGLGMTPEVQARVFDPFFTTKPVGQGTGLGLSISYQIVVQQHGGQLKCISKPGEGAEFCIEIPLRQNLRQYIS